MAKLKKEDVLDYLESASMLEVSELISDIEEKFGVSAAAPVAVAAAPAAGGDASGAEEKSDFNIDNTFIASGSPKRALYSITFIPLFVSIKPPYNTPT